MDKIKEILENCSQALQDVPNELRSRFSKGFKLLYAHLQERPEVIEKTIPIILVIYTELVKENHLEAFKQLILLLVLLGLKKRKKKD